MKLSSELQNFWDYRDTLSIELGLITKGNSIVIPMEIRDEGIQYIHEGHQGMEKCLLHAKDAVFWPNITYDV